MNFIDPSALMERLARDLPSSIQRNVILVGSLAAAYHYEDRIQRGTVRTKDADLLLQPRSVAVKVGQQGAKKLRDLKWQYELMGREPQQESDRVGDAPVVRLYPPDSKDYFVEFLTVQDPNSQAVKDYIPVLLPEGYFCLPSFKFIGLTAWSPLESKSGLMYARPSMMALANLLSHPKIAPTRLGQPYGQMRPKRSNKDLGRVLALAWLEGQDAASWFAEWRSGLTQALREESAGYFLGAVSGLRDLLDSPDDLSEAWYTCDYGLLAGLDVSIDQLRIRGERLLADMMDHAG
jgi:hypothetical protein